jgi:2-iminobutanoate/2-iminopropanoate deaminase
MPKSSASMTGVVTMKIASLLCGAIASLVVTATVPAQGRAKVEFLNSGKVVPASLPFSEAVRVGDILYLSGQIGVEPGTLKLVPGGLAAETRQTMNNIRTTLEAHGYAMRDLVKCTVMLADMSKWSDFNAVYKAFFADRFPARSAVGANGLALGAQVEIECIAAAGDDGGAPK